jgi:starvation-inducible DNA-binding protein
MARKSIRNNSRSKREARNSAAPKALATPTDLPGASTRAIANAVNPLIADAFALYVKTKNFHWHLSGPQFRDYHLMFDEHAAGIFEDVDEMAERLRMLGETTIRSISHIARLQTIADDDDAVVAPREMLERLLQDNRRVAKALRAATSLCDDHNDPVTSDLLQGVLGEAEKRIWFLFEALQRA